MSINVSWSRNAMLRSSRIDSGHQALGAGENMAMPFTHSNAHMRCPFSRVCKWSSNILVTWGGKTIPRHHIQPYTRDSEVLSIV